MKYALLFLSAGLVSAGAFASANGSELIGLSPESQALGGTGVSNYTTGTDAIYKNAALLGESTSTGKVVGEFYGTIFNQSASANNGKSGEQDSQSKMRFAPQLAATYKMDEHLSFGFGLLSFGGATADYTGQGAAQSGSTNPIEGQLIGLSQLKTTLNLMRIAPAVAYKVNDMFSVGISPFANYGEFVVNEDVLSATGTQSARAKHGKFGVGVTGGVTVKPMAGLSVGVSANSPSKIKFEQILDLEKFNGTGITDGTVDGLNVEQPFEFGVGATYVVMPALTVTADYRFFNWAKAEGYKELGWQDRGAFGVGVQYKMEKAALRVGYQYAKSPIEDNAGEKGSVDVQGHSVLQASASKLALVAFPGIAEHHISLGGGYSFTDDLCADLSFVFSPSKSVTRSGMAGALPYSFTAKVSQWSLAAGLSYKF